MRILVLRGVRLIRASIIGGVERSAAVVDFLGQLIEEDALRFEIGDDGGLFVGVVPGVQEVVELAEAFAKTALSERDICTKFITPAVAAGVSFAGGDRLRL